MNVKRQPFLQFNIDKQDKLHAQLSWAWKAFYILGALYRFSFDNMIKNVQNRKSEGHFFVIDNFTK